MASDTISARLIDVTDMVEKLDKSFKELHSDLYLSETEFSTDSSNEKPDDVSEQLRPYANLAKWN